ncbi:MAG: pentapeptide repeat-containing protein [Microthrixaceae bacterium]
MSEAVGAILVALLALLLGNGACSPPTPVDPVIDCSARGPHVDLSGCDLADEVFAADLDLTGVDFSDADLSHASFQVEGEDGVTLTGADFSGADLTFATFDTALMNDVDLTDADLRNAWIGATYISGVATRADLSDASLLFGSTLGGDWTEARFVRTFFGGAFVGGSNFTRADFTDAAISGSSFFEVDLTQADLTGATLEDDNDLTGAVWSDTTCPNGVVQSTACI